MALLDSNPKLIRRTIGFLRVLNNIIISLIINLNNR
jgi:hypothetical protein